jgi:hypothetical protein
LLDQLEAERSLHRRFRNLVVAATGTGKTVLAGFDVARLHRDFPEQFPFPEPPRLLFIAHRKEILQQALLTFRQVLRGLLRRTPSALAAHRAVDSLGWLLFAGADGTVYYFNFRTSQMSSSFPSLAELPADMPLLRPRAKGRGAAAYEGVVPAYLAARSHTQLLLSHGVATHASLEAASCGVRSSHLWMRPCTLSTTLAAAQTLGIDPRHEPHYMWLAHLSLCLPLPIGWEARATPAEAEWKALPGGLKLQQRRRKVELDMHLRGFAQPPLPDTYYEYRMLGFSVTQWERPQLSFCRGVLAALRKAVDSGLIDMNDLVEIWRSSPIPEGPITLRNALPQDVKDTIVDLLANLHEKDSACAYGVAAGETAGFLPIGHEAYETIIAVRRSQMN